MIKKNKKANCKSATIKELLNFGEKHPEVQRDFPIIALGSIVKLRGSRRVGCLDKRGSDRRLYLNCYDEELDNRFRFLGVMKKATVS